MGMWEIPHLHTTNEVHDQNRPQATSATTENISTMYQENSSTLSSAPNNNDTRLQDEAEW